MIANQLPRALSPNHHFGGFQIQHTNSGESVHSSGVNNVDRALSCLHLEGLYLVTPCLLHTTKSLSWYAFWWFWKTMGLWERWTQLYLLPSNVMWFPTYWENHTEYRCDSGSVTMHSFGWCGPVVAHVKAEINVFSFTLVSLPSYHISRCPCILPRTPTQQQFKTVLMSSQYST